MDYVYIHHIVDVLTERMNEVMFFLLFIIFIISSVSVYLSAKKSKHIEDEKEARTESLINPRVDEVISVVLKGSAIIFVVTVLALLVAQRFLDAHDRKVKIETTKKWTRVTATILDARAEEKYIGGKHSEYDHCYHIRVGYEVNQTHYTSEIEFLEPCELDLVVGANYSNAARFYYPLNFRVQILVDPKSPQHVRDVNFIKSA